MLQARISGNSEHTTHIPHQHPVVVHNLLVTVFAFYILQWGIKIEPEVKKYAPGFSEKQTNKCAADRLKHMYHTGDHQLLFTTCGWHWKKGGVS